MDRETLNPNITWPRRLGGKKVRENHRKICRSKFTAIIRTYNRTTYYCLSLWSCWSFSKNIKHRKWSHNTHCKCGSDGRLDQSIYKHKFSEKLCKNQEYFFIFHMASSLQLCECYCSCNEDNNKAVTECETFCVWCMPIKPLFPKVTQSYAGQKIKKKHWISNKASFFNGKEVLVEQKITMQVMNGEVWSGVMSTQSHSFYVCRDTLTDEETTVMDFRHNEHRCRVANTAASYRVGPRFKVEH
jgi:hypothetical protein